MAAVSAVLLLTACVPAEQQAALEAGRAFQEAVRERDAQAACELLSPAVHDRLTMGGRESCPTALAALDLPAHDGDVIEVWGGNAQLRWPSGAVFLAKFRTGWKVTGAGCRPRPDQPYACLVAA